MFFLCTNALRKELRACFFVQKRSTTPRKKRAVAEEEAKQEEQASDPENEKPEIQTSEKLAAATADHDAPQHEADTKEVAAEVSAEVEKPEPLTAEPCVAAEPAALPLPPATGISAMAAAETSEESETKVERDGGPAESSVPALAATSE